MRDFLIIKWHGNFENRLESPDFSRSLLGFLFFLRFSLKSWKNPDTPLTIFCKNPENARIVTLSRNYCDFLKFSIPYWEIVFFRKFCRKSGIFPKIWMGRRSRHFLIGKNTILFFSNKKMSPRSRPPDAHFPIGKK